MYERNFKKAVRINSEKPGLIDVDVKTSKGQNSKYSLVSIPFYLTEEIERLV